MYREHMNLIQDFGFFPLPYPSFAQSHLSVAVYHFIATYFSGLQHKYVGEHVTFGHLSLPNFT
jgi:hypothetical protein